MQACFDGGAGSGTNAGSGNGVTLEGVAATGAPISNGTVEIFDAEGKLIPGSLKTDRYGKYSASVKGYESPFLIVVSPLTGDPVLSMASQEDVLQGKKVNVTPLTHVVVSNVFGETNPEVIKELQKEAATKKDEIVAKIESKKKELQDSLKTAMEALGVDSKIDIMNGSLSAGSGQGMDKLLDAIELKQEKEESSSKKSTIALKGGDPIVEVTPVSEPVVIPVDETKLSAINSQLTALEGIKEFFKAALADYHSIKSCNGETVTDPDSPCYKTKIRNKMMAHMDPGYKYNGLGAEADTWSWFCEDEDEDEATSEATCKFIRTDLMVMTDITIQNYKKISGSPEAEVAYVTYNTYDENGVLHGSEGDYVRKEKGGSWKFYGNQRAYPFHLESRSVRRVEYKKDTAPKKSSEAQIEIWVDGSPFEGVTSAKLIAVNSKGEVMADLNSALGAANKQSDAEAGLILGLEGGQYSLFVASKTCPVVDPNTSPTEQSEPCNEWESNRITLNSTALNLMNSSQRFFFEYVKNGNTVTEEFFVSKPLLITDANEATYLPTIENESSVCGEARSSYLVQAAAGSHLSWSSFFMSAKNPNADQDWYNYGGQQELDDDEDTEGVLVADNISRSYFNGTDYVYETDLSEIPAGLTVEYGSFYLGSEDQLRRRFVKEVSCAYTWVEPAPGNEEP